MLLFDNSEVNKLNVYPNPATNNSGLVIEVMENFESLSMIKQDGSIVYSGESQSNLDLSNYTEGLYVLRAIDKKGKLFTTKVVIK